MKIYSIISLLFFTVSAIAQSEKIVGNQRMKIDASYYARVADFKNPKSRINGYTKLHYLATWGYVEDAEKMIKAGADVDAIAFAGSALNWSAANLQVDSVALLLHYNANPNTRDSSGFTPMMSTLWQNLPSGQKPNLSAQEQIIDLLLSHKANLNLVNAWGDYPLCVEMFNTERRQKFLSAGADPNLRAPHYYAPNEKPVNSALNFKSNSPLTCASSRFGKHIHTFESINEAMSDLVQAGAKIDSRDDSGNTALMNAAANENIDGVDLLLKAGANPNAKNNFGQNALMLAVLRLSEPNIVKTLLPLTQTTAKDIYGRTVQNYLNQEWKAQEERADWTKLGYNWVPKAAELMAAKQRLAEIKALF